MSCDTWRSASVERALGPPHTWWGYCLWVLFEWFGGTTALGRSHSPNTGFSHLLPGGHLSLTARESRSGKKTRGIKMHICLSYSPTSHTHMYASCFPA